MKTTEMKKRALVIGLTLLCLVTLAVSSRGTSASSTLPLVKVTQNAALDFTLVNATGYDIKELYIGVASNKDWDKSDEILKGKMFKNGASLDIKFHPKATAEKWDLRVEWADGDDPDEWLNLKLTEISKMTIYYDRKADKTWAKIEN